MPDFADALERELLRAARRRSGRRARLTGWIVLRAPLAAPVLATVLLALCIGAAVIALPGRRYPAREGQTSATAREAQQLRAVIAGYAVLRRKQTAADRSLAPRQTPAGAIPSLTRYLTTVSRHRIYLALTRRAGHITGWMITADGTGAGISTFAPYPLPRAQPTWVELRQTVAIVPDSVSRVTWWTSHRTAETTRPHQNVDLGPRDGVGATFYAGRYTLAQVQQPEGQLKLTATHPAPNRTGNAYITATNGTAAINVVAQGLPHRPHRTYGVWLYSDQRRERFLGLRLSLTAVKESHTIVGEAVLPHDYGGYHELLITRQPDGRTDRPGPVVFTAQLAGHTTLRTPRH